MSSDITHYNEQQEPANREICELLEREIRRVLPEAEGKVWHRHPVWFLDGNPVTGYHVTKKHVKLLFWSGQSFDEPGLVATGSFKMGEGQFTSASEIDVTDVDRWLGKARDIQWDYKNIIKRKGVLERIS
jgi:hypothetical protein